MAKEETEAAEVDYTKYVDKPATGLQEHLTNWIKEQTGVTFATKKEEAAFDLGVKLTVFLRMRHQASPENQDRIAEQEAAREEREAEKAQKTSAKSEPKAEKTAKKAAAKAEPEAKPTAKKSAAKKSAATPAAKKPTAKKATAKAGSGADVPF